MAAIPFNLLSCVIITCVHVHNFGIMHEHSNIIKTDEFFIKCQRLMNKEHKERRQWEATQATSHSEGDYIG